MILPSKHTKTSSSLIWSGGLLVHRLRNPKSVGVLWEEVKRDPYLKNFQKFTLTLDLLFLFSIIELKDGILVVKKQ